MDKPSSNIQPPEPCEYQDIDGKCLIITQLTGTEYYPTCEDCTLCCLDKKPRAVNTITRHISNNILREQGLPLLQEKQRPGSNLAWTISWFVNKPRDCQCPTREEIMNAWGYEGCKRNKKTIHHWLRESAHANNIRVPDRIITLLIKLLIG